MRSLMIILCLVFVLQISASIINIPADQPTIQEGIDVSVDADTVLVQPGTYFENINYNGKNITVASLFLTTQDTTYISQTIINGNQSGSVVTFESGEDSSARLIGFSITGGSGTSWGGGIFGGGIYCTDSSPSINYLYICENEISSFYGYGGGASFRNSSVIISNTKVINNSSLDGGGFYFMSSNYILENMYFSDNEVADNGGAIFASVSIPSYINCSIQNNSAYDGGGIYYEIIPESGLTENLFISENIATHAGGGVYCHWTDIDFKNYSIFYNSASVGAGITFVSSQPTFNTDNRSSIYLNRSLDIRGQGLDIFSLLCSPFEVIVDTFTVIDPTDYFASPIDNYTFDILNSFDYNFIDSDLYVSVNGNDSNSGLNPDDPLKTITYALSIIKGNHAIHIANGEYSQSTNGETFPLIMNNHIDLFGEDMTETILNAEGTSNVISLYESADIKIQDLTVMNGNSQFGGGIYCHTSSASFENLIIKENSAVHGGGINISLSSPQLHNILFYNNSGSMGGGLYCYYSSPNLNNSTFANNTSGLGGAIHSNHSNLIITNNTIVNNFGQSGNGVYLINEASVILANSILWNGNYEVYFEDINHISYLTVTNCDFLNGLNSIFTNNLGVLNWLDNNIDLDPLFVDPAQNNFRLQENSPCIDAGIAYFEWEGEVILDLSPDEYYGIAPDMGAFEWDDTHTNNPLPMPSTHLYNYPNPFNPITTISFDLNNETEVSVTVYNMKGQKVKQLIKDQFSAGQHLVEWNGTDSNNKSVSSGIYFYKIATSKDESMKKMLLLK